MPTGRVKFYDEEKGFGFITSDEGQEVFLHASALSENETVRAGSRVEFSVVDGKRGAQALAVRVMGVPAVAKSSRKPADEMVAIVEDLIKVLDDLGSTLRKGRYPETVQTRNVAQLLRRVADELGN